MDKDPTEHHTSLLLTTKHTKKTVQLNTTGLHVYQPENILRTTGDQFLDLLAINPTLLRRIRIISVESHPIKFDVLFQIYV
jgi:hypothetical protein